MFIIIGLEDVNLENQYIVATDWLLDIRHRWYIYLNMTFLVYLNWKFGYYHVWFYEATIVIIIAWGCEKYRKLRILHGMLEIVIPVSLVGCYGLGVADLRCCWIGWSLEFAVSVAGLRCINCDGHWKKLVPKN